MIIIVFHLRILRFDSVALQPSLLILHVFFAWMQPSKDLKKDNLYQADVPLLIFFALLVINNYPY